MRELSSTFRQAVYEGNRNYKCSATIQTEEGSFDFLLVDNTKIMYGGIEFTDAVTSESNFDALGSAIINSLSLTIDNTDDAYSQYDFRGGTVSFFMGLDNPEEESGVEWIRIGYYTIYDSYYNGSSITLYCLDEMSRFDRPYSISSLQYPATLGDIVSDLCTVCHVTKPVGEWTFPHADYVIVNRPTDTTLTCREVLSHVAALAGCFARCNSYGTLEIKWFDTDALNVIDADGGIFDSATPYATGDSVDGGTMSPWSTGDVIDAGQFTDDMNVNFISSIASQNIEVEDVTITGIKILVANEDVDSDSTITEYTSGTDEYMLTISGNPFITADNAQTIANWLATALVGLTFRPMTISHLSDIAIEAGDVALVSDRKNNVYKTLVTSVLFKINSYETTKCCAEPNPKKIFTRDAGLTRYSVEEKNYVTTKKMINESSQTATKYITDITNGIFVSPKGQGPNDTQTPTGWRIKDALELLKAGVSYIWAGLVNNIATVRVGKEAGGHSIMDTNGMRVYGGSDGSTQIANLGYGEGTAQSGTATAPYYTFGERTANSTVGNWSVVEGRTNIASGYASHAEGSDTHAIGFSSHAEGNDTEATAQSAHAEGGQTDATAIDAHAEGFRTTASTKYAHSEGSLTEASGEASHSEGWYTEASGKYSHAGGSHTIAAGEAQTAIGQYNVQDSNSLFIVGNGTAPGARSNAFKLSSGGTGYFASAIGTGGKTAWNDTAHDGVWLSSTGEIHLTEQSASRGGTISFHFNRSASATTSLYEGTSGVLTNTGRLVTSDWSGTGRTPVSSATTDGGRISYIQATAASLRVAGQWGTAGGSYTITDFLPPTSDIRLKKNVEDCEVDSALDIINQIRLHSFDWLHTNEHQKIGFIADELEQIDPKLSVGGGTEKDGTVHYKTVDTFYMMGYLVKAIQEQQKQIQQLQAEIAELKKGGTQ